MRFLWTGALAGLALLVAVGPLVRMVVSRDEAPPRVSRFPLSIAGGGGFAECGVESGRLTAIAGDRAWRRDPGRRPGRVACALPELRCRGARCAWIWRARRLASKADGRERSRDGASANAGDRLGVARPLRGRGAAARESVAIEAGPAPVGFGFVRRVPRQRRRFRATARALAG